MLALRFFPLGIRQATKYIGEPKGYFDHSVLQMTTCLSQIALKIAMGSLGHGYCQPN